MRKIVAIVLAFCLISTLYMPVLAAESEKTDSDEAKSLGFSISLEPESAELKSGQTQQFAYTLHTLPEGKTPEIEWSSSEPTVATVADGLVTAVGGGEATITVTATIDFESESATALVKVLLAPELQAIVDRIAALPEPHPDNYSAITAAKSQILELNMFVHALPEALRAQIYNKDKLDLLVTYFYPPGLSAAEIAAFMAQNNMEDVEYSGPVPFALTSQVIAQNNHTLQVLRDRYGASGANYPWGVVSVDSSVSAKAWQIVGSVTDKAQQAQLLYNWVRQNVYYDYDYYSHGAKRPSDDAAGVLSSGIAVCAGYAALYRDMLLSLDIPAVYISGATTSTGWDSTTINDINHAWVAFILNGSWVYADPTWDSGNRYEYGVKHTISRTQRYYNPTTDFFSARHRSMALESIYTTTPPNGRGFVFENGSYYLYRDGVPIVNCYAYVLNSGGYYTSSRVIIHINEFQPGRQMYFGADGKAVSGWHNAGFGRGYLYFDPANSCKSAIGMSQIADKWYYMNEYGIMQTGWQVVDHRWYYFDPASGARVSGIQRIDGKLQVFDNNGIWMREARNGWVPESGYWYYYVDDVARTGWLQEGTAWYYLKPNGVMQTGWLQIGSSKYYMGSQGNMQTGWQKIGSNWFYFLMGGNMVTGLVKIDGSSHIFSPSGVWQGQTKAGWNYFDSKWYYLKDAATPYTGWLQIGSDWYYIDGQGIMQTGWQQIGANRFYFQGSGVMTEGMVKINGAYQMFASNGAWLGQMKVGWSYFGGKWYYLKDAATLQTSWLQLGNTRYYMDNQGAMQTGWQLVGTTWFYFHDSGAMATGIVKVSNAYHMLASSGIWMGQMKVGWNPFGGKWYYLKNASTLQTGWLLIGSTWYYFNSSGVMVTGTVTIDGRTHRFNASGVWLGAA